MRISDILRSKRTFSFEIFPPKGELSRDEVEGLLGALSTHRPDWISVTFSAGGTGNSRNTVTVAQMMQLEHGVNALAHLTCMGATKADVDDFVGRLALAGIDNVLALRGDKIPGREPIDFALSSDLIAYLKGAGLCVGAACYPEGHVECEDLDLSIEHLKAKQDAGADFFVTQLFFENEDFYRFREKADAAGITVPITVGVMPFTSVAQIQRMAFTCGASIPSKVIKRLVKAGDSPAAQKEAGIVYACEQLSDLAANDVDGLHIYSMNKPEVADAAHRALIACGYLHD